MSFICCLADVGRCCSRLSVHFACFPQGAPSMQNGPEKLLLLLSSSAASVFRDTVCCRDGRRFVWAIDPWSQQSQQATVRSTDFGLAGSERTWMLSYTREKLGFHLTCLGMCSWLRMASCQCVEFDQCIGKSCSAKPPPTCQVPRPVHVHASGGLNPVQAPNLAAKPTLQVGTRTTRTMCHTAPCRRRLRRKRYDAHVNQMS